MKKDKLGIALVGLGRYSEVLASALQQTEHCYLAGIVSGSTDKREKWKAQFQLADNNCYSYETFDLIKDNPEIDIVYVALPNAMHASFVIRAAKAGKHVICEKPMAITVDECDRMIAACQEAGKLLSIGYRLQFEPHHLEMMRLGQENVYGEIKLIEAAHGLSEATGWRLDKELAGGGPLMDVGIYCVQAVRYITGLEPVAVTAQEGFKHDHDKFATIEEAISWQMEMPNGAIAKCVSSYSEKQNSLRVEAENGWFELNPAYPYEGIKGATTDGAMQFSPINQQAQQMDDFASCIKEGRHTKVSGEEGRQDVKILQAINKAMETGERVTITS